MPCWTSEFVFLSKTGRMSKSSEGRTPAVSNTTMKRRHRTAVPNSSGWRTKCTLTLPDPSQWHISWWTSNANLQQLESCFNCLGLVKHWSEVQIKDLCRQAGTSAKCCRLLFQLGTDYRCGPIHLMRLIRLSQPIHPHVIAVILFLRSSRFASMFANLCSRVLERPWSMSQ